MEKRNERQHTEKKRQFNPALIGAVAIVLVMVSAAAVILIRKYTPTKERMDLKAYYQLEEENDLAIVVQDTKLEEPGLVLEGRPYVSAEVVKNYLNSRFYWDEAENLYIYTTPEEFITASVGDHHYFVDKQKYTVDYQIVKVEDGTAYIALDYIKEYTAMDFFYMQDPNRVQIICQYGEVAAAEVKKDSQIRYQAGIKSKILTDVKKGDMLFVLEEEEEIEKWTKVRTSDGYIGYIRDSKLRGETTMTLTTDFVEPEYSSMTKDYTINLAWHQVTNKDANSTIYTKLKDTKGLTTISPTWFFIRDNDGNIQSFASQDYVNFCHQNGIEVWALVENITYGDQIDITSILNRTSSRQNLVMQLIAQALQYDLDGINVDIEALPSAAGDGFIQFIRELSIVCRRNNVILSVDNYVPMAYNKNYNRREQGIVADYVIIMGYDEHYAGSETAGSVASIGYVRNGIEKTLEEVPAQKVINAVPFYTRLWQTAADGTLSSSAMGMSSAQKTLDNQGVTAEWSEEAGQYYGEFSTSEGFYQIWLEENRSIEEKAKLIKEYGLAGIASWRLGFEKNEIWDVILKYVN